MRVKILLILLLFIGLLPHVQAQHLKAGAAFRKITPEKLIPISGGMGTPVMPEGARGDLYTRALVLEKGDTRIAIVSIDNLGWPAYLCDQTRKLIPGIPPQNVLIGVTHTHSAPDAYAFPDENGKTGADLQYLDWCVKQTADAVNDALSHLESASLKTAVGEAKGQIAYNYYAEKLYDPRCGVMQLLSASGLRKGKIIATLVNYAIHPEILGTARKTISPDLCGPLYEKIESETGGLALFMNSAQGGMVTADNRKETGGEANNWDECIRIGTLLADEALRIVRPSPIEENPDIYCTHKIIQFPVESEAMRFVLQNSPIAGKTAHNDDFTLISTRLNLLNIGKAQILTVPGEALPNIGYYVKRHMKTSLPFLFGLTNDAFGYILCKEDFNSFERYKYISRTSLGEKTGEIFVNEVLKMVEENPAASK